MTLTPQERRAIEARMSEAQSQHVAQIWREWSEGKLGGEEVQAHVEAYLERLHRAAFGAKPKKPKSARLSPSKFYARANEALYADPEMSPSARRFVLLLVRHARGRERATGFIAQWADELGVTERTIQNAQARAAERGFIRIERVREGRENAANIYWLEDLARLPKTHRRARVAGKKSRESQRVGPRAKASRDSAADDAALAVDDSFLNHSRDSRVFVHPPGENFFTPQGRDNSPSENSLQPIPLTPFPSADDERSGAPLVAARGHSPAPPADNGGIAGAACCQAERAANFAPHEAGSERAVPSQPP